MAIGRDVVQRFFDDDDFRQRVLDNPTEALAEHGVELSDEQHHALASLDPVHLRTIENAIHGGGDDEVKADRPMM